MSWKIGQKKILGIKREGQKDGKYGRGLRLLKDSMGSSNVYIFESLRRWERENGAEALFNKRMKTSKLMKYFNS